MELCDDRGGNGKRSSDEQYFMPGGILEPPAVHRCRVMRSSGVHGGAARAGLMSKSARLPSGLRGVMLVWELDGCSARGRDGGSSGHLERGGSVSGAVIAASLSEEVLAHRCNS